MLQRYRKMLYEMKDIDIERTKKKELISTKLIHDYKQYLLLEKSLSKRTLEAYINDLEKLLNYLYSENKDLRTIQLEDLHHFTATLMDIGINARSIARIISGIRSFYRFLILEDYIENNPTELLEQPKIGRKLPEILSVEEIDSLINSFDCSTPEGQRNRAILEVLYSCGLRVSELCNLKLSNLYFEEGFIRVEGKGSKERLVPISEYAILELKKWFEERNKIDIKIGEEDYVFVSYRRGKHLSRITIFHLIKEQAKEIQLKKTISPHSFRHSFATHLLEGGANLRAIQAMLGHERISTTEIYTHIDRQRLRQEILEHHPRNKKFYHTNDKY